MMAESKIEFAVQMTCNSCVDAVKKSLSGDPSIKNVDVDLANSSVVVTTTLPTLEVQEKLEKTGKKVVVRGYAGTSAAVAILDIAKFDIKGVVRFVQVSPNSCIIDGTIDGLKPNKERRLAVHECGDFSQGLESVGDVYADLGTIPNPNNDGRSTFKIENHSIKLPDLIGRSLVLSCSQKTKLVGGIIARSAGLFENPKMICACDGVTIWNEKVPPKAVL